MAYSPGIPNAEITKARLNKPKFVGILTLSSQIRAIDMMIVQLSTGGVFNIEQLYFKLVSVLPIHTYGK